MVFWRKGHVLGAMIDEYMAKATECMDSFQSAFNAYSKEPLSAAFDGWVEKAHIAESSCDDLRRRIDADMYENALLPESRGDILTLLDSLDRVPNKAESILFQLQSELLRVPDELMGKFIQLVNLNRDAFDALADAVSLLFSDSSKVRERTDAIDKLESASDILEREILRSLFAKEDLAPDQKILLKDIVAGIGQISDRCEFAADRVTMITIKRLV